MMLDTNGEIFPEGKYMFRVTDVPQEVDVKGYVAWQWTFEAQTDDGPATYNERFMVWLLAPLVRALGYPETSPGKFDFEPVQALNRCVMATIKHVTLEKSGKTVARMTDIQPVAGKSNGKQAAMAAQSPSADDIPF